MGYDEISPKVVKELLYYFVQSLAYTVNQSFLTGKVPNQLIKALATPTFQENEKEKFQSNRPFQSFHVLETLRQLLNSFK